MPSYPPGGESAPQQHFETWRRELVLELHSLIGELPVALQEDVQTAFEQPGKLLAVEDTAQVFSGVWALLPLLVGEMEGLKFTGDDPKVALHSALAFEAIVCAIDIQDDLIDRDISLFLARLGEARALLAMNSLLVLAAHCSAPPFHQLLWTPLQETIAGQRQDVLYEQWHEISLEQYFALIRQKSCSLLRLGCTMGATLAEASTPSREDWAQFGIYVGIAHQIENDCHDCQESCNGEPSKTDLLRGKKTLPLILAAQQTLSKDQQKRSLKELQQQGIKAAWGIGRLYSRRAQTLLSQIESRTGRSAAGLRALLEWDLGSMDRTQ